MDKQNSTPTAHLTLLQAFVAMTHFLEDFYQRTKSDDIGSLLSGLSFLSDGSTADPAAWHDWLDAVNNAHDMTNQAAYNAMVRFLQVYCAATNSTETATLLHDMEILPDGSTRNPRYEKLWDQYVQDTLNGEITPIMLTFVSEPYAQSTPKFELTPAQSFNAMIYFFSYFYEQTQSQTVGIILNDIHENTSDVFNVTKWMQMLGTTKISPEQAYNGVIHLLETYYSLHSSNDIAQLISDMKSKPLALELWKRCVQIAL